MNRRTATLALTIVFSACSEGSKIESSTIYPTGVLTDTVALHGTKGVYTGDTLCCWLNSEAQFVVPASRDAKELVLQTYEPSSGPLAQSQTITIETAHSTQRASRPVHAGRDTVVLPILPGMVADGVATVHLVMGKSIVPKDAGLNGDVRRLSIVLESALTR